MNVQKQIEEYRKRQAEKFKQEVDSEEEDEPEQDLEEAKRLSKNYDDQEQKRMEDIDLEIAQKLERELNFRPATNMSSDLERNDYEHKHEVDIGEEGHPAPIPHANPAAYFRNNPISNTRHREERKYVQQDPPKWLVHPVKLQKDNKIKVFDFTQGSYNNELRNTDSSSVNYEYDDMEDPVLQTHDVDTLESKIAKKQQKYLRRFEKEEEKRVEEAKRSGSIIEYSGDENRSRSNSRNGMNEPLLGNRQNAADERQLLNPPPNNVNNGFLNRERRIFLCLYQSPNGTYRVGCLRNLTKEFIIMLMLVLVLIIIIILFVVFTQ